MCLRVVHVYALSVTAFVFEAMPPQEDWLQKAQLLLHRVLLACIGISQFVPLAPLYGVTGSLGFCVPLLFLRYQLRYIKGLFCIQWMGEGPPAASWSTRCVVSMRRFWKRGLVTSTMCRHNTTTSP